MKSILPVLVVLAVAILFLCRFWVDSSHPEAYEIKVQCVQQPDEITCGPTSALMALLRYGKQVDLRAVQARTRTEWFVYNGRHVGMTSPEFIASAMTDLGVPAVLRQGRLESLKHFVSQNKPVVCLLRSGTVYWHYVLVIGYDENKMVIANPSMGERQEMSVQNFLSSWSFATDMEGMEVARRCFLCGGTGNIGRFGPLSICNICNGTGREPDFMAAMLRNVEILPNTMIVPIDNASN